MTKQYAVVGSPIEHSLSPQLHHAAFEYLKVDARYSRFDVPSNLRGFLKDQLPTLDGVSVTMPLKNEAFEIADDLDTSAYATSACNTLINQNGIWQGFNTDVKGLIQALASVPPTKVLILGSGATSRSAFEACRMRGDSIAIWARSDGHLSPDQLLMVDRNALENLGEYDLVISTVPLGALDELVVQTTGAPKWFFSASYGIVSKQTTHFLRDCHWIDGKEMLLWQAVVQQALFAHTNPESFLSNVGLVEAMRAALHRPVGE